MKETKKDPTSPVIDVRDTIPRSAVEAALTRWQEQHKQLELSSVATNTVIAELKALLAPPAQPEEEPPPIDRPITKG